MKTVTIKILTRAATLNPQNAVVLDALKQMCSVQMSGMRVERCILIEVADETDTSTLKQRLAQHLERNAFPSIFNLVTDNFEIEVAP